MLLLPSSRTLASILASLSIVTAAACDSAAVDEMDIDDDPVAIDEPLASVQLETDGLEPLSNGFLYEGWALIDGAPVSFGKFNVDLSGALTDADGIAIQNATFRAGRDLSVATDIVITVEPADDADIVPSDSKMLGGELSGGSAVLTTRHAGTGFASDFTDSVGHFILATPTSVSDDDETSGVWFFDFSTSPPTPGLSLPELDEGWAYEGWVVFDGEDGPIPVSTGTFQAVDMPDDSAPFSGPLSGPPVPGEDLVENAPSGLEFPTDLSGTTIVISVEPVPDDSDHPFVFKPLVGPVPKNAADHQTHDMNNNAAVFPTMTATLLH